MGASAAEPSGLKRALGGDHSDDSDNAIASGWLTLSCLLLPDLLRHHRSQLPDAATNTTLVLCHSCGQAGKEAVPVCWDRLHIHIPDGNAEDSGDALAPH